ncbi:hypothetical protein FEP58_05995 [Burkholderia multivorans]|nr:hypothetical protein [Burkholderia multivorans]
MRAFVARAAERRAAIRLRAQLHEPLGERGRIARRHEITGLAVLDRRADAADVAADHGRRARHRLDGRDAERLVPRRRHEHVGGAVVEVQRVAVAPADERHAIGDAHVVRERDEPREFRIVRRVGRRLAAADHVQPRRPLRIARHARERVDHVVDSLARHEAAELQHDERVLGPAELRTRGCARHRPEFARVESARHDLDARCIGAIVRGQIERVLRAFGDQPVRAARERVLDREARIGEAVGRALMQTPHAAERMERRHERNAKALLHAQRRFAGHEEVCVHHVDRIGLAAHARDHVLRERAHVRQQLFLRHVDRRAGRHVDHAHPRADPYDFRQVRIVATRIHVDVEPALGELLRDVCDIDVLPACIDAANDPQRRRMFTDQRDSLHGVAPDIEAAPVRPSKLLRQSSCPLLRACARTGERRKNYNALDERASDHRRAGAERGSTGCDARVGGPARRLRRRGVPAGSPGVTKRRSR